MSIYFDLISLHRSIPEVDINVLRINRCLNACVEKNNFTKISDAAIKSYLGNWNPNTYCKRIGNSASIFHCYYNIQQMIRSFSFSLKHDREFDKTICNIVVTIIAIFLHFLSSRTVTWVKNKCYTKQNSVRVVQK